MKRMKPLKLIENNGEFSKTFELPDRLVSVHKLEMEFSSD
jgi:hypothetical protein